MGKVMTYKKLALFSAMTLSLAACSGSEENQQAKQAAPNAETIAAPNPLQASENSKSFDFADFTAVELTSGDEVRVHQGKEFGVRAVGTSQDVARLEFRVDQGRLIIGRRFPATDVKHDFQEVDIEVMMPNIRALIVTGSGEIRSDHVTGKSIDLTVAGSGDLKISGGKVNSGNLSLTGSGDLDSERLEAETLNIELIGSGDIDAFASRAASITLSGSGDVEVKGGAKCTIRKMGSGKAVCK